MFDAKAEIELGMRLENGAQSVLVRWPTDQEWAARSKARKILIRRLGRGVSETVPPEPIDADLTLTEKILLNGSGTVTKAEAFSILEALGTCSVTDVEIVGDQATVALNVLTGPVEHRIKVPTAGQVVAFKRSGFRMLDLPYSQQQIQLFIEPAAQLWDACGGTAEGYEGAVPAIHKDTAVRAVIDYLDRKLGAPNADESF